MNEQPQSLPPADELPPVQPPTGAFILQLFLVPALIVAALFLVVGMFGMLADSGADPQQHVQALLHENKERRWRAAHALANMLTADQQTPLTLGKSLTSDRELAVSLTDTLQRVLNGQTNVGGSDSEEDTRLRAYLATALGMFDDPVGVPVLLEAMRDRQTEVRLRAVESVARLANDPSNPNQPRDLGNASVMTELTRLADDQEAVVRKMTAYAMGVVAHPSFIGDPPDDPGPLLQLADDADADVSYNAAAALARMGRTESIPLLARMLMADPSDAELLRKDAPGEKDFKVTTILIAALESIKVLAKKNPSADLQPLSDAVHQLTRSDYPRVRILAKEVATLSVASR